LSQVQGTATKYLQEIISSEIKSDESGERYLDVSKSRVFSDQNTIIDHKIRTELHSRLQGRLVVFDFVEDMLAEVLSGFEQQEYRRVLILGTPGIGKSTMRNVHAHLILQKAKNAGKKCIVVMAKGGNENHVRLILNEDMSTNAIVTDGVFDERGLQQSGYELGTNFFVLADISNGNADHLFTDGGLILYSSPNETLVNHQILKQGCCRLGCPLPSKESLLRYSNERMRDAFEKYGPIPRLVWGAASANLHEGRLKDSLNNIEEFLGDVEIQNYLKGPHRFFYMDVKKNEDGKYCFNLDQQMPSLIYAPRHVMRIVAKKIVSNLLSPRLHSQFGMQHKAVDGILFKEVCLYLLEHHAAEISLKVRNLNGSGQPLRGFVQRNVVALSNARRQDVEGSVADSIPTTSCAEIVLIVPRASNYPGLDAVLVLSEATRASFATAELQMTRSFQHPVSDEGVDELVRIERKMKEPKFASRNCLLFIVPENNFEGFKEQTSVSTEKQGALKSVQQLVGCIVIKK
jgi:hypothetical protein